MLDYFLILFLSHLLTDFVFQTDGMAIRKYDASNKAHKALLLHAGIFFITSAVLFLIIQGMQWLTCSNLVIILLLSLSHYIVDFLKGKAIKTVGSPILNKTGIGNQLVSGYPTWLFWIDQFAHLILIILFTVVAFHNVDVWEFVSLNSLINIIVPASMKLTVMQKILIISCILILITSFTNIIVKLSLNTTKIQMGTSSEELISGRYIGAIERILTIVAIMAGAYEAVAILYASKTAIRFGQIQESAEFRDYYILGTLISALSGVLCGIFARFALQ